MPFLASHSSGKPRVDYSAVIRLKTLGGVEKRLNTHNRPNGRWYVYHFREGRLYREEEHRFVGIVYVTRGQGMDVNREVQEVG